MRQLLTLAAIILLLSKLMGQDNYKHEIQIGPAIGVEFGSGLHTFYLYQINKYIRVKGGFVANQFSGYNMLTSHVNDAPLWAQVEFIEVRNKIPEKSRDRFTIGKPVNPAHTSVNEFYVTPEFGIDFLSPQFINKRIDISLGFSLRTHLVSSYFVTHVESIDWYDSDGNFQGQYYVAVNRYDRYIDRFGISMTGSTRYNFSKRSFAGFFLTLHGYSYKGDLLTSFTDIFTTPYASIGAVIGTKLGKQK